MYFTLFSVILSKSRIVYFMFLPLLVMQHILVGVLLLFALQIYGTFYVIGHVQF